MINYEDTRFLTSTHENFYSKDDVLTDKVGFNVAFGFSSYDGSGEFEEDPDFVTIEAKYRSWGIDDEGHIAKDALIKITDLSTHRCSGRELGMEQETRDHH